MARLRYNGLSTTLGGSLTSGATSVTFAAALTHSAGTNVPTITGSDFIPLAILTTAGHLSEIVYLTAYTAAGTTGTITRGQEGTTAVVHSSGDPVTQAPLVGDLGGFGAIFGDGSDGNVTVSTSITLTRDMFYDTLTVTGAGTINAGGFRIYCQTALLNSGSIHRNGNAGASGSGGSGLSGGSLQGSQGGASGGTGVGTAGSGGATSSLGGNGGAGGSGTPNAGGAGGTQTAPAASVGTPRALPGAIEGHLFGGSSGVGVPMNAGAGGGAGGGDGSNGGKGGGGGAAIVVVNARAITNSGTITATGGAGAAGTAGNTGGGGGGGGGVVLVNCTSYSGNAATAAGGAGGAGFGTGTTGTNGGAGNVYSNVWS